MAINVAFLFPGQGSQFVGMGESFMQASPTAKARAQEAADALGFDIGKLIAQGPEEKLMLTANTQPAILLASVIALDAIREKTDIAPKAVAGHSLGEFTACFAAGAIEFTDCIRLVRKRGELMQSAVPVGVGAMAAIIGLDKDAINAVCAEAGEGVAPANFNSPEQTVIAGEASIVENAMAIAKEKGAKRAIALPVSAPFHNKMMVPAQEGLAEFLTTIEINDPKIAVIRNVDAQISLNAEEVVSGLIRQVTGCVQWVDSIKALGEMGIDLALEIGPGKALCGLIRRIDQNISTLAAGSVEQVDRALEAMNG